MLVGTVIVMIMPVAGCFFRLQGLQVIDQVPDVFFTDRIFPVWHGSTTGANLVVIITVAVMSGHFPQIGSFWVEVLAMHSAAIGIVTMAGNAIVTE